MCVTLLVSFAVQTVFYMCPAIVACYFYRAVQLWRVSSSRNAASYKTAFLPQKERGKKCFWGGRGEASQFDLKAYPEPNPRGRERAGWDTQELGRLPVLRRSCGRLLGSPAHESPPADPAIQQRRLVEQRRRDL